MSLGFVVRQCAVELGRMPTAAELAEWANHRVDERGEYRLFGRKISAAEAEIIRHYSRNLLFDFQVQEAPQATNNSVYSILFPSAHTRNAVVQALSNAGFETKTYYEPLVEGMLCTDYVYSHILSLPIYPEIAQVQPQICDIINKTVREQVTPGVAYLRKGSYMETYLRREF